ncbi:MAG: SIR2 family NAD-dependent protein deacylase [Actinomycetota bacterium]
MSSLVPDEVEEHYGTVMLQITSGRVVPFLGAGANLCSRPDDSPWELGRYLPSGRELARYLAERFDYPFEDKDDLGRVAQYITVTSGSGPLYAELRGLFDLDYPPTSLHLFLAQLSSALRDKGYPVPGILVVTTNYDDIVERAFKAVGEPFDVVTYIAEGEGRGKFLHFPPDADPCLIDKPNEYQGLPVDASGMNPLRPVILKLHGAVDRLAPDRDSFVITEDHYIDYLTRADISSLVPVTLASKLRRSNFLFLGYSLRDWNLRVILHRIWGEQRLTFTSWAVQFRPDSLDRRFWRKRDVEIMDVALDDYVVELTKRLTALQPRTEVRS